MSPLLPYHYAPTTGGFDARGHGSFFGARAEPAPAMPEEETIALQESERHQELLRTARKRFRDISDYESEMRLDMLEDFNFRAGKQWDLQTESDRALAQRPTLTINRVNPVVKIIVNEIRQSRASIQVNPVGDGADRETADVLEGITRHVEIRSDADTAYDTASDHQVTSGRGWMRVLIDWVPGTFDQEILIDRIPNPFAVYMDTACRKADCSDARWAFVIEDLDEQAFKTRYPGHVFTPLREFDGAGIYQDWYPEKKCRVAEYFYKEPVTRMLSQLDDGTVIGDDDPIPPGRWIVAEREEVTEVVKWVKMTAREVLEERDWPGRFIPVIPVLGDEIMINGKRQYVGIVRFARDPQRMFNYMRTAATEAISLVPKAMWLAAEGQIENYEEFYRTANVRNLTVLYYKPVGAQGQPVAPPQRLHSEVDISAISGALAQSDQDFKLVTNVFDPSLGQQRSPDESGKAILARQRQSDTASFAYGDNQARAIRQVGRIVVDLIPRVYTDPQLIHIVNPDGSRKPVWVNQHFVPGPQGQPQPVTPNPYAVTAQRVRQIKLYDVRQGRYDVTVSTGPSYQSRRQEAASSQIEFLKAYPQAAPLVGDLVAGNMDWPGASEFAERLKKMLPPQLAQDESNGQPPINPAQLMGQMQQLAQANQQLLQMLQGRTAEKRLELDSKERIAAADRASKERIAATQAQATIIGQDLRAKGAQAETMAELAFRTNAQRLDLTQEAQLSQLELIHETFRAQQEHQHDLAIEQQQQQAAAQQAAAQQQHEVSLAQQQQAHEAGLAAQQQQAAEQPPQAPGA
jgi:Phage P22-like portal protein